MESGQEMCEYISILGFHRLGQIENFPFRDFTVSTGTWANIKLKKMLKPIRNWPLLFLHIKKSLKWSGSLLQGNCSFNLMSYWSFSRKSTRQPVPFLNHHRLLMNRVHLKGTLPLLCRGFLETMFPRAEVIFSYTRLHKASRQLFPVRDK